MQPSRDVDEPGEVARLEQRVRHLELVVEDLQDAHYKRATRFEAELAELRRSLRPAEIARELAANERRHGL